MVGLAAPIRPCLYVILFVCVCSVVVVEAKCRIFDEMYRDTKDKVKYGSFKRTSEFNLEIVVCFVGNWNLFSKIGICFAKWGICFQKRCREVQLLYCQTPIFKLRLSETNNADF